jgi:NADPH:quinone reductase-like Zn-dependent oxidoreductase
VTARIGGFHPLTTFQSASGHAVTHWPATFGNDGAGIVEAIGEGVAAFKKGDEVLARFDPVKTISAAFQVPGRSTSGFGWGIG